MAGLNKARNNGLYDYYAFISYNHKDLKWAKWLQHKLEAFTIPSSIRSEKGLKEKKIRPIFRDQTDMRGGVIKEIIAKELAISKFLIVICSPDSASSNWVNDEVEHFIAAGRYANVIPFIVDGDPSVQNSCFPAALRKNADAQLLGISVREVGKKNAVLRVVSTLLGVKYDTVKNRHLQRIKRRGILWAAGILALCIGFGSYYSHVNRIREEQRKAIAQADALAKEQLRAIELADNKAKLTEINALIGKGEKVLALGKAVSLYNSKSRLSENDMDRLYSLLVKSNYVPAFTSLNRIEVPDQGLVSYWLRSDAEHPALCYCDFSGEAPVVKYITVFDKYLTKHTNYEISSEKGFPLGIKLNKDGTVTPLYGADVMGLPFGEIQHYDPFISSELWSDSAINVQDDSIYYNGIYQTKFEALSKFGCIDPYEYSIKDLKNGTFAVFYSDPATSQDGYYDPTVSGGVIVFDTLTGEISNVPIPALDADKMFSYENVFGSPDKTTIYVVKTRGVYEYHITPYLMKTMQPLDTITIQGSYDGNDLVIDEWFLSVSSLVDRGNKISASNANTTTQGHLPDYRQITLDCLIESYTVMGDLLYVSGDNGVYLYTLDDISLVAANEQKSDASFVDAMKNALQPEGLTHGYEDGFSIAVNDKLAIVLKIESHYIDDDGYNGDDIVLTLVDQNGEVLVKFNRTRWAEPFFNADKAVMGFVDYDSSRVTEAFKIFNPEDWPVR